MDESQGIFEQAKSLLSAPYWVCPTISPSSAKTGGYRIQAHSRGIPLLLSIDVGGRTPEAALATFKVALAAKDREVTAFFAAKLAAGKKAALRSIKASGHRPGRWVPEPASGGVKSKCAKIGCDYVLALDRLGGTDYARCFGLANYAYGADRCPWHDPKERRGKPGAWKRP